MLAPDAAKMRVVVERTRLQRVERVDVPRAQIDAVEQSDAEADRRGVVALHDERRRGRVEIDAESDRVAHVGRPEEQQDEIGSAVLDAPGVERLPEIPGLPTQALAG